MTSEKFGEIELIRDESPKGIILREDESGVTLEECLDKNGRDVDILIRFHNGCTLKNKEDLYNCLVEARKYEVDLKRPIYIKVPSEPVQPQSVEDQAWNKDHMEYMVRRSGTHPWNFRVF